MESQRQKKIASVLQRDLVEVLQGAAREGGMQGVIISVTKVKVTCRVIWISPNLLGGKILCFARSSFISSLK